jgi:predicted DNA-binding protein (MmcQ/YjbR family)
MLKSATDEKKEAKILMKLRDICRALPEASETTSWGHPTFKVRTKTFAVLEWFKGNLCICFKATLPLQQLLIEDRRFFQTPYIGKQGWVSMIVDRPPKWSDVKRLVRDSYELVQTKPQSRRRASK